jgi:hypothetical protein
MDETTKFISHRYSGLRLFVREKPHSLGVGEAIFLWDCWMTVKEKLSDVGMIGSEVIVEDEYLFGGIVGCN